LPIPDIQAIASILSSVKAATEIARAIKDTDLSLEKAEAKLKLAELISTLADAKMEIAEIQEVILKKDKCIRQLQEQLSVKEELTYEQPYYWLRKDASKDGPFCQQCYDKDRKLIRLQSGDQGYWQCYSCKSSYIDSTFVVSGGHDSDFA